MIFMPDMTDGDAAYHAGLKRLQERRKEFLRETDGRKVHRVQLPKFGKGDKPGWYAVEPRHSDIYGHARRLLAEAPERWPEGASPFDVIETYTPDGTLSMYAEIGRACQWRVQESKHGNPTLELVRW
jgi:hypothetical protein